jgi:hypothetical protein
MSSLSLCPSVCHLFDVSRSLLFWKDPCFEELCSLLFGQIVQLVLQHLGMERRDGK